MNSVRSSSPHDQDEATGFADIVVVMSMGRIEPIGKPAETKAKPATDVVRQLLAV